MTIDSNTSLDCSAIVESPEKIKLLREKLVTCTPTLNRMAGHFSLLAGETRLKILTLLHNAGELCVCDMASILGMSPAAVSQHLSRLRAGGLVTSRRDGMTINYRRTDDTVESCPELPQFRAHNSTETGAA